MSQPAVQPPQLRGLAAHVGVQDVRQHLLGRPPEVLEAAEEQHLVDAQLRGVAAEVHAIVGLDPTDEQVRELALWAISVGVAKNIESALFPEQQFGDQSRAQLLTTTYLALLNQLRGLVGTSGGAPLHSFPDAQPYPGDRPWGAEFSERPREW